jgi:hypothetical protein
MAKHKSFRVDTNVKVYFCDPQSPWQRGTIENTNGLLRQYFPKKTDLSGSSQSDLNKVIARRTSVINQLRAFLLERGMTFAKTPARLKDAMPEILEDADAINVVITAAANKLARIASAVLSSGQDYRTATSMPSV